MGRTETTLKAQNLPYQVCDVTDADQSPSPLMPRARSTARSLWLLPMLVLPQRALCQNDRS